MSAKEAMSDTRSDEALVKDYLAGDKPAFGELVRRYQGRLLGEALTLDLANREAHWAVQKTFWSAWHKLRYIPQPQKFRDWLYQLLKEKCRDQLARRRKPKPRTAILSSDYIEQQIAPTGKVPLPDDIREKHPRSGYLKRRLLVLPDVVREQCLALLDGPDRLLHDLRERLRPYEEIVQHPVFKADKVSVAALMKRYSRILDKLREWLLDNHYIDYWGGYNETAD